MPDEPFPERVGVARRPTWADLPAVVGACYGGWRTNVLSGRYGRLLAAFPPLVAGISLALYAAAPAALTAPTGWFGLSLAAWFVVGTVALLGLAVLQPAITALIVVRRTSSAAAYVLDGAHGEPAVLSLIRLRHVGRALLVENHAAARPGRGWGRRLRVEIGPPLCGVCDGRGWTLQVVAVNRVMAEVYCAEFDGMAPVERSWLDRMMGHHPLERRPRPVGPAPAGR